MKRAKITNSVGGLVYVAGIEYSKAYDALMPRNCAVVERTGDGKSVGPCTHYLEHGMRCPRHGKVKREARSNATLMKL